MAPSIRLFDLSGKVALVTGARRGLGLAMARGLAEAGAETWLAARTAGAADEVARELVADGLDVRPIGFDIADGAASKAAIERIIDESKGLHILVNNAAIRFRTAIADTQREDFDSVVRVNLTAQYDLARYAALEMARAQWGRILMISSMGAALGTPGNAAYAASKAGLEALLRVMAVEFGSSGVTCNAIAPGKFATEYNAQAFGTEESAKDILRRCPLRRHGDPSEIVGPCLMLASDAGSYVSGQVLTVDGGYSIQM